ncbi:superoxide dismutase [Coleofasciculus sp. FACHB-64]|uniref:superoxide dismutase n=1 Tax=Cyanophyceae TaxID=3028117 RepID=UPI001682DD0B|nr:MULTISPECIES: superoxide dismutase [unclassified Coleofasciculus]MBD1882388.1 superoxide dismutase [Coleofasciculus sp. FACHB-T130]MBD2044833.1 superoxide dismutase [Coleofasciculus sp. FACHB-64]MBD2086045.1 superoxide dismutase [Coleofasciculus sp. FACHB-542]MBD2539337.1 superoxide dismutase [Coleofasciculus sp. FACHB-SPT36]
MAFELPPLPYDQDALESSGMSARTLEFHYGKHHAAYVNTLNNLVKDTELADKSLEEIIKATYKASDKAAVFNNAAQVWNHTFYWNGIKPNGGGNPSGELAEKINASFGSLDKFKEEFKNAGGTQFGSGWAWLIKDGDTLKVTKSPNAENPIAYGQTPLLTMDVWEHAYYLDYQNSRPNFMQNFVDHLINWDFVAQNLTASA